MKFGFVYEQLVDSPEGPNGVSVQISGLFRHLKLAGHSVTLFSTDRNSFEAVRCLGVEEHTSAPTIPLINDFNSARPAPWTEWRFLQQQRPDIVIIGNLCLSAISIATLCRLRGVPCAIFAHCDVYDYVRIRCSSAMEFLFWKLFLWTVHAYIHRLLGVPTLSRSQAMVPLLQATGCGPHFYIVPGGADDQVFRCIAGEQSSMERRKPNSLLFVGRINAEKNIQQLLDIMSALGSQYTLTLVGRVCEEDFGETMEFKRRLPPNVNLLGEIPHGDDKLVDVYNRHEAFLFASEFDTFGNVIIEALLCGCIPIVKDCLGPGEIVQHGRNGLKWKTTAEAVTCIRETPRPTLSAVVARGKQYTINSSYNNFTNVALQIVSKNSRRRQPGKKSV